MRKDPDLPNTEHAAHTRNTARGKAGVNRAKRHQVKQDLQSGDDGVAKPAGKKYKKRFGIKHGSYHRWYKTERARDDAFDAMLKSAKLFNQMFRRTLQHQMDMARNSEKVER